MVLSIRHASWSRFLSHPPHDHHLPRPGPQAAARNTSDDDGGLCKITLGLGLGFPDGEPIRARSFVASLRRWMTGALLRHSLAAAVDQPTAVNGCRLRFRLERPVPFIMPGRGDGDTFMTTIGTAA